MKGFTCVLDLYPNSPVKTRIHALSPLITQIKSHSSTPAKRSDAIINLLEKNPTLDPDVLGHYCQGHSHLHLSPNMGLGLTLT